MRPLGAKARCLPLSFSLPLYTAARQAARERAYSSSESDGSTSSGSSGSESDSDSDFGADYEMLSLDELARRDQADIQARDKAAAMESGFDDWWEGHHHGSAYGPEE